MALNPWFQSVFLLFFRRNCKKVNRGSTKETTTVMWGPSEGRNKEDCKKTLASPFRIGFNTTNSCENG